MQLQRLTSDEQRATGFTHKAIITYADLVVAGLVGTVTLMPYGAWTLFDKAAFRQATVFDAPPAMTNLAVKCGWNSTTGADDLAGLLASTEICENATEVLASDGTGTAFAAARTGYVTPDAGTVDVTFTAVGANLNTLTQGEIHIFLGIIELNKV